MSHWHWLKRLNFKVLRARHRMCHPHGAVVVLIHFHFALLTFFPILLTFCFNFHVDQFKGKPLGALSRKWGAVWNLCRHSTSPATRKLAGCSSEFIQKHHRYMDTIFHEEVGNNQRNMFNGCIQKPLYWHGDCLFASMKAAIHFVPDFLTNLEVYTKNKILKIFGSYSTLRRSWQGTFWRYSECGRPQKFITVMDEVDIGQW